MVNVVKVFVQDFRFKKIMRERINEIIAGTSLIFLQPIFIVNVVKVSVQDFRFEKIIRHRIKK